MASGDRYDISALKGRLPFADLMAIEGVPLRRAGTVEVAHCPFHEERSRSFTVYGYSDPRQDHAHCFGCGWNGDIIGFVRSRRGCGFVEAVEILASLASLSPEAFSSKIVAAVPRVAEVARTGIKKQPLPKLRALTDAEAIQLAALRSLDADAIRYASWTLRRVGFCQWPQSLEDGDWEERRNAVPSWVMTDRSRHVAQFRPLDGSQFTIADGSQIKAWTKGSPTWPLGASELGGVGCVLLVEGGADMLAAYHFLARFNRLEKVVVVAMLGASCSICAEAIPFFSQKRVRIMMDEDTPRAVPNHPEKPPIYPGREAAARWTNQLTAAGAAVESFSLAGLLKKDGSPVKDLNDLALVQEAAWLDPELRQAFLDFDF